MRFNDGIHSWRGSGWGSLYRRPRSRRFLQIFFLLQEWVLCFSIIRFSQREKIPFSISYSNRPVLTVNFVIRSLEAQCTVPRPDTSVIFAPPSDSKYEIGTTVHFKCKPGHIPILKLLSTVTLTYSVTDGFTATCSYIHGKTVLDWSIDPSQFKCVGESPPPLLLFVY
jgi:hypothetical protein